MVLLDSGNFSANPTPQGNAKTEVLIKGMGMLGYSAANVGERDVRAGYIEFEKRASKARFPMISANIVRSDNKQPVLPPKPRPQWCGPLHRVLPKLPPSLQPQLFSARWPHKCTPGLFLFG